MRSDSGCQSPTPPDCVGGIPPTQSGGVWERWNRKWWLAAVCLVAACPAASGVEKHVEKGPVKVTISLVPDEIRVGDTVTFTIAAVAARGVELIMPEFSEALGRFRIIDYVPTEKVDRLGRTVSTQRYTLQVGMSGKRRIPPILVEFVDRRPGRKPAPDDFDAYELLTEPLAFEVQSVAPSSVEADLAGPLGRLDKLAPPPGPTWPWIVGSVAVIAAAAPFAWRLWAAARRRARMRSAYDIAMSRLEALLGPREPGRDSEAFFVELSGIARHYLEDRFELHAPELTTEEFLAVAGTSADLTGEQRHTLQSFLRQADLVKFARVVPSTREADTSVAIVRQFLDETRANAPMLDVAQEPGSV